MKDILKDKENLASVLGFLGSGIGIMIASIIGMMFSFGLEWKQPEAFIFFLSSMFLGFIIVMYSMHLENNRKINKDKAEDIVKEN